MQRRQFLSVTGSVVAASLVEGPLARAASSAARGVARRVLPMNRGWRFSPTRADGFELPEFDDRAFERVTMPHTNRELPWHGFDERLSQFISAYRRTFRVPSSARAGRVFVDFEGVMTAARVWINGVALGEYRGGYTPFSHELTPHLRFDGDNVLAVEVDSTERADIPPFGDIVDYLTFGGIYREVSLRIVPKTHFVNLAVRPRDVLGPNPSVEVRVFVDGDVSGAHLEAELLDGDTVIAHGRGQVSGREGSVVLDRLPAIRRWDLAQPSLYQVRARLVVADRVVDTDTRRFGFRHAEFTAEGFKLNGEPLKLRGLNRHQTFPYIGGAMPARVQRDDARILKQQLKVNIVRTSHYPQSRHFLDACDELGLLVLEEIPGWQHIGDAGWKDLSVDNVQRMIERDWNHPSIVLWGVRINESLDDHDFYTRTNALARALDPTRATCGIRYLRDSERLEDVFTFNDFGFPLQAPNHPAYLNTEFIGHTFPTKSTDNAARLTEHTLRHARVHDQLASSPAYAGGLGWCAFDYNTHGNFGSGDHICYHGVSDIFREPKPAAGFYRSQVSPEEEVVLEPAFHWSTADDFEWLKNVVVSSNCDRLAFYVGDRLIVETGPDRASFANLRYPPFRVDLFKAANDTTRNLRIVGFVGPQAVIEKRYSGRSIDHQLQLRSDATELLADEADATRVVFRVTDEFGNVRPYATGSIALQVDGPARLIGENPFALVGGLGAVWIKALDRAGRVTVTARHAQLGEQSLSIEVRAAPVEAV